jgi:hypothetical protein
MELTARESIRFFGLWDQPRTMLAWEDIKSRRYSWRTLRDEYFFSRENLQRLQPDKGEWIKRGALTLHDLVDMSIFPINPISDLHADLAEIWSMHWTPEQMALMGVTYAQMRRTGLNFAIMQHFGYSIQSWSSLQLDARDVAQFSDNESVSLFGLPSQEVQAILACKFLE